MSCREFDGIWGYDKVPHIVNNPNSLAKAFADYQAIKVHDGEQTRTSEYIVSTVPAGYRRRVNTAIEQDCRRYGFGELFEAGGILMLQRNNTTEIDFHTDISRSLRPILRKLHIEPKSWGDRVVLPTDKDAMEIILQTISAFVSRDELLLI